MLPDLKHVIQQVRDSKQWPFRSKEQLCAYTQACIRALHVVDANFGNLKKAETQNHCKDSLDRLHATDIALYKSTGQIVDFISSAGFEPDLSKPEPENDVIWGVGPEGEYPETSWFAPLAGTPPVDPPVEPPVEPPTPSLEPRVAALEAQLVEILKQLGSINEGFAQLSTEVVRKPLPEYVGSFRILGFTVTIVSRPR